MASTINASTSAGIIQTADTSGVLALQTGGTTALTINTTGSVAFGTSASAYGTSGQILTSNGDAVPTWQAPPASMIYPGAGVAVSNGSAWGTSLVAASANTANALVQRDGSGNFSAGTITATLSGNAATATNVAGLVANTFTTYGNTATSTAKAGYYGLLLGNVNSHLNVMADGSGNGGFYRESSGTWPLYYLVANASVGIMGSTTSASAALYVNGAMIATGNITAYSDRRMKKDIVTIDNALEKTNKLRGVYYKKIKEDVKDEAHHDKLQMGVIAQEVLDVAPEVVIYDKENDRYGVSYANMAGLFIEAIKELTDKVATLEAKLEQLTKDKS